MISDHVADQRTFVYMADKIARAIASRHVLHLCDVAVDSISHNTSYGMILQSIEGAKSVIFQLLWDVSGFSAVFLSRGLPNCKARRASNYPIVRLRDLARSSDKTSYTILNPSPVVRELTGVPVHPPREWYHFVQGTLRNHISDVTRKKTGTHY